MQAKVAGMLTVDPVFNGTQSTNGKPVPVVTEIIGDVVSYTQQAIGQMGLVAVIMTPDFKLMDSTVAPLVATVRIQIQVSEFYAINQASSGTGIPAATLVSRIIELLHWKPHNVVANIDFKHQLITLLGVSVRGHTDQRAALTYLLMFQTQLVIKTL